MKVPSVPRRSSPAARLAGLARLAPAAVLVALAVGSGVATVGCKKGASAATPAVDAPPSLVVRDDSAGLQLTWIDEKGDFHIEQAVKDVPLVGRDAVRVVDEAKEEGRTGDTLFVADLRTPRPDGTYVVRSMSRADFDGVALARRGKNGATLANACPAPSAPVEGADVPRPGVDAPPEGADKNGKVAARPQVIIYGASWCSACHQAAAYLKRKGIPFVEKDIEADAAADSEMRGKLAKNGLRGGSIPVLDVNGTVMVGFSAPQVENALGRAL